MLVAPIDGVAYQNKYKFGLNVYKLNSNWTKSICFGSLIWPGSSTKL